MKNQNLSVSIILIVMCSAMKMTQIVIWKPFEFDAAEIGNTNLELQTNYLTVCLTSKSCDYYFVFYICAQC